VTTKSRQPALADATLDERVAREVAAVFDAARSDPGEPRVAAAYRSLERQSDRLFRELTHVDSHWHVRVVFSRCRAPYEHDEEMIAAVRSTGVLEVTTTAAEPGRPHPLLGSECGGAYDRFRAVHDLLGHVQTRRGFDRQGEFAAWLAQDRFYRGPARAALATELHAEHSVCWTSGAFSEHKATLLPPRLRARARAGLAA
jgi:hypothetical protein